MKAHRVYTALSRCAAFMNAREEHKRELVERVSSLIDEEVREDRALWSRINQEEIMASIRREGREGT